MVDISSQNNKINITVSSSGNTANTNVTPDYAQYYSEKSKEWAISDRIVDNTDYSSKYYANESKKQADISTAKATEVIESGNTAVSNIESARDNAITNVNTAGATQVALATEQATIATNKASEVVESGNNALTNIDTAKNNAITSITNQETTSKNVLIDEGATQIGLIQNEGATQIANVQSTGFYMRDDKLYFINSQGEETEFKSGGSGLELCDIGMALYFDETKGLRRYLNGQIVDINTNTQAFLNRLKEITTLHPSLLCTEEEWQTAKTMSAFGQVGKFVFNYSGDDIVSVRLPRVVNVQGLFDLQNLGMTVGAGLPNITGYGTGTPIPNSEETEYYGALYKYRIGGKYGNTVDSIYNRYNIGFDASRSNSIYGKSNTVQPESIQYPYFIQIATGSETENNIINDIELNNPYSLFDSKYSDHELNNLSWLKSEGQWNSKAVYTDAYDKLLKVYNGTETVEGLSVKLSTEDYDDYDFVLNTVEETFRLPLSNNQRFVIETGNGYRIWSDGYVHQWGWANGNGATVSLLKTLKDTKYQINLGGGNCSGWRVAPHSFTFYNVTASSFQIRMEEASTLAGGMNCHWDVYGYLAEGKYTPPKLYFYVGETVQNANLIDAGRIEEILPTKTNMLQASGAGMPSSKYINLTLGASGSTYTAPANGWVYISKIAGVQNAFCNLLNTTKNIGTIFHVPGASNVCQGYLPVSKNDIFIVRYNATGTTSVFRFIYAEGAQ